LKSCCDLQDHYDDERNMTVFHNTTSDLQDQDQDQDRIIWSQTSLVIRPTVSDHICILHTRMLVTGRNSAKYRPNIGRAAFVGGTLD